MRVGFSSVFGQPNAGEKGRVLDLKSSDAVDAIRRLVAGADIIAENFRPGVMRRLKLDHASLQEPNPKLIYCSISGSSAASISGLARACISSLSEKPTYQKKPGHRRERSDEEF